MAFAFRLPSLGEKIKSADVVHVLVKPGDVVQAEQTVAELETEKAAIDLPAPVAGKVVQVLIKDGGKIGVNELVMAAV